MKELEKCKNCITNPDGTIDCITPEEKCCEGSCSCHHPSDCECNNQCFFDGCVCKCHTPQEEKKDWEENKKLEEIWDYITSMIGFDEKQLEIHEAIRRYVKLEKNQARADLIKELREVRDSDSCECDNCHRVRKFIKKYENQ